MEFFMRELDALLVVMLLSIGYVSFSGTVNADGGIVQYDGTIGAQEEVVYDSEPDDETVLPEDEIRQLYEELIVNKEEN